MALNDDFEWRQTAYGLALVCRPLERHTRHLFTSRQWRLGSSSDEDRGVAWQDVPRALGLDEQLLTRAHQVHGAAVLVRRAGDAAPEPTPLPPADIIVSDDPSRVIAIQTADCVPLLLVDVRTGAVAAAHAGWRGLAAHVPAVTVDAMARTFGTSPSDLIVAIGPSICAARYEVDAAVRDGFAAGAFSADEMSRWFVDGTRPNHWQFDGWASARDQLRGAGVPRGQIYLAGLCTADNTDLLCSYRRDGKHAGRIAAAISPSPRRP
jgi:YfiH family protein